MACLNVCIYIHLPSQTWTTLKLSRPTTTLTMKLRTLSIALAATALLASCGGGEEPATVETTEAQPVVEAQPTNVTYAVNTAESVLGWEGAKLEYGHSGVINISGGSLNADNGVLTGGSFTIDMATMVETGDVDSASAADLVGHLMSPDFFDVATYPTATFEITNVADNATDSTSHNISGNLTIKDTTNNITFPAMITMDENMVNATASFTIDRNAWGITYAGVILGVPVDKAINDNISFDVNLKAAKSE